MISERRGEGGGGRRPHIKVGLRLNLHSHDLRVPVGSLLRFKLSLPQCIVPGV